jgi:hypothetical protein
MLSKKSAKKPFSLKDIGEQMLLLSEKITEVASQPSEEEIWCKLGHLWYGHPVTPLLLEYKGLLWLGSHPPDPRGKKMYKRPAPYVVNMQAKDLVLVLDIGLRTAQRLLQMARVALNKKKNAYITVEEFCFLNDLKEETIQKKLAELYESQWNEIKNRHKNNTDDR